MVSSHHSKRISFHRLGALVTLGIIAVWGVAVLWLHLVTPAGAHVDEIVSIATITLSCWVLMPFYWGQVRWSYAAGMLPVLGLFIIGMMQAREGILVFSPSPYNIVTILVYAVAAASIYLSLQSYRERPATPWWGMLLGICGVIAVAGACHYALSANKDAVYGTAARWTQSRIVRKLERLDTLDEKLEYLVAEGGIPSLAVGIVVNDQLVWSGAYGEQPQIDAIYNTGSISKPFVATAILQLHERGLVGLDDDVSNYLPLEIRHPDYPSAPITIRMLLTHQSGLSHTQAQYLSYILDQEMLDWEVEHRGRSIYGDIIPYDPYPSYTEFLEGYLKPGGAYYSPQVWSAKPGTTYGYSSPGYDILGYVVEQVTGQPFSDYLQENIFDPLDMPDTGLRVANASDRQVVPYDQVYGVLSKTVVRFPLYGRKRIGGGGLHSTVPDLAQYLIAHLNRGQVNGHRLLKPETVASMHAQRVKATADIGMTGYGYGFNSMRTEPWEFYGHYYDFHGAKGHGGSDYGYSSRMYFATEGEGGYGIIVLSNMTKYFKSDLTWFFGIYLRLDNLLMQEAEVRFRQQTSG